ncbi:STAS domain-containing protein [Jiangella rhizosphaerae]|uniref:STAS domain-containing protein n=1 Tax=Jiangella rhizosphaerae TaxID=2293569 RepID=A0A418KP70_9ACTN|nr:hypothetical protein [Jiangella rhizosphaerae]RIQ21063.1 hypothetical protein DY240_16050 [Jiangella rhizosphaerae]
MISEQNSLLTGGIPHREEASPPMRSDAADDVRLAVDVEQCVDGERARLALRGLLDLRTAPLVAAVLEHLVGRGCRTVVMDIEHVALGRCAVDALIDLRRTLRQIGGHLKLERTRRRGRHSRSEADMHRGWSLAAGWEAGRPRDSGNRAPPPVPAPFALSAP